MSSSTSSGRLTRAKIVDAVTDILETSGVEAVSTRTIGEALHVHPTALYRHFRDMDELLREAADRILAGVADASDGDDTDGLEAAAALCRRLRAVLMAYPGAASVVSSGPSRMANERAITERLLGLLSASGLADADVVGAYHALVEFTVGSAAIDAVGADLSPDEIETQHRTWRAAYLAASPGEFPHTVLFAADLYPSVDEQFEYGITLIINGLHHRAASAR